MVRLYKGSGRLAKIIKSDQVLQKRDLNKTNV